MVLLLSSRAWLRHAFVARLRVVAAGTVDRSAAATGGHHHIRTRVLGVGTRGGAGGGGVRVDHWALGVIIGVAELGLALVWAGGGGRVASAQLAVCSCSWAAGWAGCGKVLH